MSWKYVGSRKPLISVVWETHKPNCFTCHVTRSPFPMIPLVTPPTARMPYSFAADNSKSMLSDDVNTFSIGALISVMATIVVNYWSPLRTAILYSPLRPPRKSGLSQVPKCPFSLELSLDAVIALVAMSRAWWSRREFPSRSQTPSWSSRSRPTHRCIQRSPSKQTS